MKNACGILQGNLLFKTCFERRSFGPALAWAILLGTFVYYGTRMGRITSAYAALAAAIGVRNAIRHFARELFRVELVQRMKILGPQYVGDSPSKSPIKAPHIRVGLFISIIDGANYRYTVVTYIFMFLCFII